MTEQEEEFLFRAIIRQENYSIISNEMKVDRKTLSRWWDDLKVEREKLSAIRQLWRSKLKNQELVKDTYKNFHSWYSSTRQNCHYCDISEKQIAQLWKLDPELTKRKRGKSLEIDRKMPNETYEDTQNLVFCCYWCNNAKTETTSLFLVTD